MGEILPDGSIQGYQGYCQKCGAIISTNIQGNEIGEHACRPQSSPNIKSEQEIENDAIQYANSRCLPKTDEWFNRIDGFKAGAEWQSLQYKIEK